MPPRLAKGAGRKGIAKFRRFPAAGRESCDLNCTGRGPSLAGYRRTYGENERSMRRKFEALFAGLGWRRVRALSVRVPVE